VPKHKDFGFQRSARPEQPDQGAPDQPAKIAHRWNYPPIRGPQSAVLVCGRDSRRRSEPIRAGTCVKRDSATASCATTSVRCEERLKSGDPRPSLAERYREAADRMAIIERAKQLVQDRLLLADDVQSFLQATN
jgi:hypothetical protein